jgi:hypothetical protein
MKKHTPGPWNFGPDSEDILMGNETVVMNIFDPKSKMDGHIASVGALGMDSQTIEKNAALIAAAPEMLAALETILFGLTDDLTTNGKIDAVALREITINALNKAKGE